jgi:antitoxin MazE
MQIAKWGNSLAVRLPKALIDRLGLKEGDDVELRAADDQTLEIARTVTRDQAMARLRSFRGMMPSGFRFDRDEANER